jgi:hypothetical protein
MALESALDGRDRIILPMSTVPWKRPEGIKKTPTERTQRLLIHTGRIGNSTKLVARFLYKTYLTYRVGIIGDIRIAVVIDINSFLHNIKNAGESGREVPTYPGIPGEGNSTFK